MGTATGLSEDTHEVIAPVYKFTGKERDAESGNDYFEARYCSSAMFHTRIRVGETIGGPGGTAVTIPAGYAAEPAANGTVLFTDRQGRLAMRIQSESWGQMLEEDI